MRSLYYLAAVLVFSFVGTTYSQTNTDAELRGHLLGPGDEITVRVLGETQFDFVASIDEEGRLEVPFFDEPMQVKCKSERELRSELTTLLKKYLISPQVNVRVTKRNSRPPVSIYGEVRAQQQVDLTRRAYLLELISLTGGVTEKAGGMVQVFRTRNPLCGPATDGDGDWSGSGLDVPSRLYSLASLRQGREEANPEIFPGDIIVVQKAAPVYVTGEVIKPGELDIPEAGLPLTQAIAMASGITREAKSKNVKIFRRKEGSPQPEVIAVNYQMIKDGKQEDVMLKPFDIVEVDKAKKSIGDILLDAVIGIPGRVPLPIRPL